MVILLKIISRKWKWLEGGWKMEGVEQGEFFWGNTHIKDSGKRIGHPYNIEMKGVLLL